MFRKFLVLIVILFIYLGVCAPLYTAWADSAKILGKYSNLPLPRYASLRSGSANMRNGPSKEYPILWVYKYKGMPVKILDEYENWRKVLALDGAEGWFHVSLLSSVRTVLFLRTEKMNTNSVFHNLPDNETILFRKTSENSFPIARIRNNTSAKLLQCNKAWCKVKLRNLQGWVKKENIWGVERNEAFK